MKVLSETSRDRQVTISATIDELATLYDATRRGRRNEQQNQMLEEFGDALLASDQDLEQLIQPTTKEQA